MSPKFVLVLGLLFAISLAVLANTSNEETNGVEPQRRRGNKCRYGCCGRSTRRGYCSACCPPPGKQAPATTKATEEVEPQKRGHGGCKHGCCGSYAYGQCSYCCPAN